MNDLMTMFEQKKHQRFVELKTALLDLEAIKYDFADCGAKDSSVDVVLQGMIWAAWNGVKPEIFEKPEEYRLFKDVKGSKKCAKLIAKKMAEIVDLLTYRNVFNNDYFDSYVKEYCWRFVG